MGSKTTQTSSTQATSGVNIAENAAGRQKQYQSQIAGIDQQIAQLQRQTAVSGRGAFPGDNSSQFGPNAGQGQRQLQELQKQRASLQGQLEGLSGVAPISALERQGAEVQGGALNDLTSFVNAGPGMQDVEAGVASQRSLADLLDSFSKGGFLPSAQEISAAQGFAADVFAPQRLALEQAFEQQGVQASRGAALSGRSQNDPVLRNMLSQDMTRQNALLASQQGAYGAQYAQQMPQQRLQYAGQLADVRGGLATQAMQNRTALLGLGNQIQNAERNFRLSIADRTSNQNSESVTQTGGFGEVLKGIAGVAGTAASIGSGFQQLGSLFGNSGGAGIDGSALPASSPTAIRTAAPAPMSSSMARGSQLMAAPTSTTRYAGYGSIGGAQFPQY